MFLKIPVAFGVLTLVFFLIVEQAQAIYDPTSVPNNRFGIHIIDENDLNDAVRLVNSSGGDWGYVALVIREDDRQKDKWQAVFDRMRRMRLIPIVRLATKVENGVWIKPRTEDIGSWVDFLNSLNWVIENRYVVIFNEPNHALEWGGEVNPQEYAWYLKEFSHRLKEKSADFFILPAGLDASAPNGTQTLDEVTFIKRMLAKEPDVYNSVDGWTSHSYPNPGFSGSPFAQGQGTIKTYEWEQNQFGLRTLPVFITETGWRHNQGKYFEKNTLSPEQVADNYTTAYTSVWNDNHIAAVIPFLLNYQDAPFDHFSWRKLKSQEFYPIYAAVASLPKVKGAPKQHVSVRVLDPHFPEKLVTQSEYSIFMTLENRGQTILDSDEGWNFDFHMTPASFQISASSIPKTEPFQQTQVELKLKTSKFPGSFSYAYEVKQLSRTYFHDSGRFELVPPPSLLLHAQTWFHRLSSGNDFQLLIYDNSQTLIHEETSIGFDQGIAHIDNVYNLIPNRDYRLVLIKPYYLPRQIYAHLTTQRTHVYFSQLLPFDPSQDGVLTLNDAAGFFKRPIQSLGLLLSL